MGREKANNETSAHVKAYSKCIIHRGFKRPNVYRYLIIRNDPRVIIGLVATIRKKHRRNHARFFIVNCTFSHCNIPRVRAMFEKIHSEMETPTNSTEPINYWPMQRIAAGVFVALWGMVSISYCKILD